MRIFACNSQFELRMQCTQTNDGVQPVSRSYISFTVNMNRVFHV